MHPRMRELILERLALLRATMPAGVTVRAFLWDEDEVQDGIKRGDREIAVAYAWLTGVADAEDVTVTQLVEDAEEEGDLASA